MMTSVIVAQLVILGFVFFMLLLVLAVYRTLSL